MNRVVITGLGIASPLGSGRDTFWHHLIAGRSGIGPITLFDVSQFPIRIGGQVPDLDLPALQTQFPAARKLRDRKVLLGLSACQEALVDSGISPDNLTEAQLHVGVSLEAFFLEDLTPVARSADIADALAGIIMDHPENPTLQTPLDSLAQLLGDRYRIMGGRFTNCSACAAGAQAIGQAFRQLQDDAAAVAIAGAADSMLNPLGLGGFSLLRILSTENDRPREACRPFEAGRQGTVLGEGAAFLILETLDHAQARGARIYAELLGYGSSLDAFRVSDPEPSGRGAALSMAAALRDARMHAADIDAVNAHGTGTPKNDIVETKVIKEVLGTRAREIPVHAVKSMTGHLIAASGAVEAVAAALTVQNQVVPPTINLQAPDPECDLDYVPHYARPFTGRTVLSNSFGFGGQNATLIFGKPR